VRAFKEAFGVPEEYDPIGAIAVGYDSETEKRDLRSRRRPIEDLVHYGAWSA
jgi:nitroreductase